MSLKILFFNSRGIIDQKAGGDITQMLCTARELRRLGVKVDFWDGDIERVSEYDLVHIFNLQTARGAQDMIEACGKFGKPIVLSTIWWDLGYFWECRDLFKFSTSKIIRALSRLDWRLGRGYSFIRGSWSRKKTRKSQECLLEAAKVILPNSIAELEILVSQFKSPDLRAKAVIVPNAADAISDEHHFIGGGIELPEQYVLEAASVHPGKGQALLLRAMMGKPEIPIVFAGHYDKATAYWCYCTDLGKKRGNTYFLGNVDHEKMKEVYAKARVHVLPSVRESPGLASLEAAYYGANCVVSIHCPLVEYFGRDVSICDPSDEVSVANAVMEAWASPLPSRLKDRIRNMFTWQAAAKATLLGYRMLGVHP